MTHILNRITSTFFYSNGIIEMQLMEDMNMLVRGINVAAQLPVQHGMVTMDHGDEYYVINSQRRKNNLQSISIPQQNTRTVEVQTLPDMQLFECISPKNTVSVTQFDTTDWNDTFVDQVLKDTDALFPILRDTDINIPLFTSMTQNLDIRNVEDIDNINSQTFDSCSSDDICSLQCEEDVDFDNLIS
ncbi:hypothetical protein DP163_gp011 [Sea otter poxvirus]|uniref:Uncharacterized protein n=1 Tax=Sea otter poxvirus TaxID=1416741 RepID=A0A2U9QHJ1_9POXV|nr:hypothetical protein DP163_gp011 [Sea otter poxvirus]AWU47056.1 hypothetical protein [Sea otter poxvirus]